MSTPKDSSLVHSFLDQPDFQQPCKNRRLRENARKFKTNNPLDIRSAITPSRGASVETIVHERHFSSERVPREKWKFRIGYR